MNRNSLVLTTALALLCSSAPLAFAEGGTPGSQGSGARIGAAIDDAAVTTRVKAKFVGDERLKDSDIHVDTRNGVVTLTGTAPSDEAKAAAEELARQAEGVKSVDNQITLPGAKAPGTLQRSEHVVSDSWITTKVKSSLLADHVTKGLNIGVKTMNGTVSLSGTVGSQAEFDRAVQIAKNIKGVKDVNTTALQIRAK